MVNSISTAGQNLTRLNQLTDLRQRLNELERQIVSGKESDTFSGLGADAQRIQGLRADENELNSFIDGGKRALTRTQLMTTSMDNIDQAAIDVIAMFQLQVKEGDVEIGDINRVAGDRLDIIHDLMNSNSEGRYLFAGNDTASAPMASPSNLDSTVQGLVEDWMDGTLTTDQFLNDIQNLNNGQLGYAATLENAGNVSARIDETVEIDYTVKADDDGMRSIMIGAAVAKHLREPGPGDVVTEEDFYEVFNEIPRIIRGGREDLEQDRFDVGTAYNIIDRTVEEHKVDASTLQGIVDDLENTDMTEAIVKLQTLQTQLTASFQTANVIQSLTLVNFI